MLNHKLLLLCLIWTPLATQAGNLIPNPGFEDHNRCPKGLGEIGRVSFWHSPNGGTPDYFHLCYTRDNHTAGIPINYFSTRALVEGEAYAGIYAGEKEVEYLQVKLLEPLQAGKRYCLRFQASPASANGDQMDALRVCFLTGMLVQKDWGPIEGGQDGVLHFNRTDRSTDWLLVSRSFVAQGGENTMIVGYFGERNGKGYTYLDDFELYEYDAPEACGNAYYSGDAMADMYNFVPNPGFEQKRGCPEAREQMELCDGWRVMENTPDFFHRCGSHSASVPRNALGTQEPHEGDAYSGFWVYQPQLGSYREFISMTLQWPLEKGEVYCLSMWVSLAEICEYALYDLQMLPARSVDRIPSMVAINDPRLVFLDDHARLLDDTKEWTRVSALFVANGGERGLTIGNFRKNDDPRVRRVGAKAASGERYGGASYYYVDDVSLCRIDAAIADCPDDLQPQIVADPDQPQPTVEITELEEEDSLPEPEIPAWQAGDTLVLENFLFAFDASELSPAALPILDTLGAYLARNPGLKVQITGHTDDQGSESYNLELSRARAESVLQYLWGKGIAGPRLSATGKGESAPVAPNDHEQGRARNRRVEVEFLEN